MSPGRSSRRAREDAEETREFASLRAFLEAEHAVQMESREGIYDRPVEDRVASGTAVDGAVFAGIEEDGTQSLYVFTCERNDSRFRPGTRVLLSRGDPRGAVGLLELVDDRHDGEKYVLRLSGQVRESDALDGPEPWTLDEAAHDLLELQLEILRRAQGEALGSWLAGTEDAPEPKGSAASPFKDGLEGTMRRAFDRCLLAKRFYAVQGPPGSGKTHLLARLALHFALEERARVLITAVSHQAIHNALGETYWVGRRTAKEHPLAPELLAEGFFKLGASRGKNEGLPAGVRTAFRVSRSKRPLIAGSTVYAAMLAAGESVERQYDVVLFDEAGQAPLVLALGARLLAPKTVFIGDDAQLPPVVQTPPEEDGAPIARMSVLELVRGLYRAPFLLDRTRRLSRELCSVVSDCFYGGALEPTREAAERELPLKRDPAPEYAEVLRPDRGLVFLDVPHKDCRSVSEGEAHWAAGIAREAARCGLSVEEIGIIAPYRTQCNRIRFLIGGKGVRKPRRRSGRAPLVATVERFQGQEREMVIISLTSSRAWYLARLAGFLFNPNRLNVAVSRARTKAVLIGSRGALTAAADRADPDSEQARGFEVFRRLVDCSHVVDGARPPVEVGPREEADGDSGEAFEPGALVEHPKYGPGRVLARSVQLIDNRREWVNEIRFSDGKVRSVIPRLTRPAIRPLD